MRLTIFIFPPRAWLLRKALFGDSFQFVCGPETPSNWTVPSNLPCVARLGLRPRCPAPAPPPPVLGASARHLSPLQLAHLTQDHGLFSVWLFLISFFLFLRLLNTFSGGTSISSPDSHQPQADSTNPVAGFPFLGHSARPPGCRESWGILPRLFPGTGPGGSISLGGLFPAFLLPEAEWCHVSVGPEEQPSVLSANVSCA